MNCCEVVIWIIRHVVCAVKFMYLGLRELTISNNKDGRVKSQTTCQSPECIRCQNYTSLMERAPGKIIEYTKRNEFLNPMELERVHSAVSSATPGDMLNDDHHDKQQPNILYVKALSAMPWWETEHSNVLHNVSKCLRRGYKQITEEFYEAYENSVAYQWKQNTSDKGKWTVYHLYNQGKVVEENCRQCPKTAELITSIPSFMKGCVFGNACFSVMHPGTNITKHCGPANVRLRCHLG